MSRTHVEQAVASLNANTIVYSVTPGETLFVYSIVFSGFNSSTTQQGDIRILDGTNLKVAFSIPTAVVGTLSPSNHLSIGFPEPLKFLTNFSVDVLSGTIVYSVAFAGFQE